MKRFSRFVTGHPIAVLVLVGLATLVALQGIVDLRTGQLRLAVDPGIDRLLPAGDEQRRFYDRARELFGGDQTLLLVLEAEDVFRPDTLAQVQRITRRVEQIRPVTATTLGLCLGFLVLSTSELRYQVQFGLLSAFTLAVGWGLELTLSPAICSRIRLVTLWDLLRIDLGPEPQRSIPLFAGLSSRQARIFALMSHFVSVRAGERLFGEGDRGREMFVVIDGELVASTSRGGARVEFSHMRRGDVVGEVALFSEGRTTDVDVAGDARLLHFDDADLVQLGRRYPRIAAQVNRKLNRVLASRVVSTAQALRG